MPQKERPKIDDILEDSFNISIITKIEFLGWEKHSMAGFEAAKEFLSFSNVIPIEDEIADLAIEIRCHSGVKLPESVIAATSIYNDLILVNQESERFPKHLLIGIIQPI